MAQYFCSFLDVVQRMSFAGVSLRLDDDPTAFQQVQQQATNEILEYATPIYAAEDLQTNAQSGGWVNDRATDLAAYYLACRRLNAVPKTATNVFQRCIEKLERIQLDLAQIPGVAQRHTSMPTFSNVYVDPSYSVRKVRVETQISELSSPKGYAQAIAWDQAFLVEF